jgi:hypothetical protein
MDTRDVEVMRQVAYVFSQSVCALAEIEAMKAENTQRQHRNESMAYTDADFVSIIEKYCIHSNGIPNKLFER